MDGLVDRLFGQALDEAVPGTWTTLSPDQLDRLKSKFAELIVRECCDWIDGSPATDAGQLLLTKSFITANLKGHFGVKE